MTPHRAQSFFSTHDNFWVLAPAAPNEQTNKQPMKTKSKSTKSTPQATTPKPPAWLGTYAQEVWRETAPLLIELGRLDPQNETGLAAYCIAASDIRSSSEAIEKHGLTVIGRGGFVVKNPACATRHAAMTSMLSWAKVFGMTPASDARLTKILPPPRQPSKFDNL